MYIFKVFTSYWQTYFSHLYQVGDYPEEEIDLDDLDEMWTTKLVVKIATRTSKGTFPLKMSNVYENIYPISHWKMDHDFRIFSTHSQINSVVYQTTGQSLWRHCWYKYDVIVGIGITSLPVNAQSFGSQDCLIHCLWLIWDKKIGMGDPTVFGFEMPSEISGAFHWLRNWQVLEYINGF